MKVLIVTIGPRGDIAPCIAMVKAMRAQGSIEHIAIVGHASSKRTIENTGAHFFDIGPEMAEAHRSTPEGRALDEGTLNPAKKRALKRAFMAPLVKQYMEGAQSAVESFRPDFVVLCTEPIFMCTSVIERAGVPYCWFHLTPLVPTEEHAPPIGFGTGEVWFRWVSRIKWRVAARSRYELLYKDAVNEQRASWGMPPMLASPYDVDERRPITILGYSPTLCRQPSDWNQQKVFVVGSLVDFDSEKTFSPPPELSTPLGLASREAAKPIVISFGSTLMLMKPSQQRQLLCACIKAMKILSLPAIIFSVGANPCNGGQDKKTGETVPLLDDDAKAVLANDPRIVLWDRFLPHTWLFKRAAVVVCHGGAGTVHAAITAGAPVIVSPVLNENSDQPWWGAVVQRQGVGIVTQRASLHKSGRTLAQDIRSLLDNISVSERAKLFSREMENEAIAGADRAARLVTQTAQAAISEHGRSISREGRSGRAQPAAKGFQEHSGTTAVENNPPPVPAASPFLPPSLQDGISSVTEGASTNTSTSDVDPSRSKLGRHESPPKDDHTSRLRIGSRVQLYGIKAKPELNGKSGSVSSFNEETNRFTIDLDGNKGRPVSLKKENLRLLEAVSRNPNYESVRVQIGTRVQLQGLRAKPELNGKYGIVTAFVNSSGRWTVELDQNHQPPLALKSENLRGLPAPDWRSSGSDGAV